MQRYWCPSSTFSGLVAYRSTSPRVGAISRKKRKIERGCLLQLLRDPVVVSLGGPAWETWNPRIREHLVKTQNQSGHEAGSWYFEDQYAKEGGRLYTTAMCAMTLEVYYRFAPLYQQSDRPFEL